MAGFFDKAFDKVITRSLGDIGTAYQRTTGDFDLFADAIERAEEEEKKRKKFSLSLDLGGTSSIQEGTKRDYSSDIRSYEDMGFNRKNAASLGFGKRERERAGQKKTGLGTAFDRLFSGRRFASEIGFDFGGKELSDTIKGIYDAPKDKGPSLFGISAGDVASFAMDEATAPGNWLAAGLGGAAAGIKGASRFSRVGRSLIDPLGGANVGFGRALAGETLLGTGARVGSELANQKTEKLDPALRIPIGLGAGILGGALAGKPADIGFSGANVRNAVKNAGDSARTIDFDSIKGNIGSRVKVNPDEEIVFHGSSLGDIKRLNENSWLIKDPKAAYIYSNADANIRGGDTNVYVIKAPKDAISKVPEDYSFSSAMFDTYRATDPDRFEIIGKLEDFVDDVEMKSKLSPPRDSRGRFSTGEQQASIFSPTQPVGEMNISRPRIGETIESDITGRVAEDASSARPVDDVFRDRALSGISERDAGARLRGEEIGFYRESQLSPGQNRLFEQQGIERLRDVGPEVPDETTVRSVLEEVIYGDGTLRDALRQGSESTRAFQLQQPETSPFARPPERAEIDSGDVIQRTREVLNEFPDELLDAPANPAAKKSMLDAMFRNRTIEEFRANKDTIIENYRRAIETQTPKTVYPYQPPGAPGRWAPLTDSAYARAAAQGDPDPIILHPNAALDPQVRLDDPDAPPLETRTPIGGSGDGGNKVRGADINGGEPPRGSNNNYDVGTWVKDLNPMAEELAAMRRYPKFLGKLLSDTRINPAAGMQTDAERLTVAFRIQNWKARQIVSTIIHGALDAFDNRGVFNSLTGREMTAPHTGVIMKIDESGLVKGTNKGWGDIFEEYYQAYLKGDVLDVVEKYNISAKQQEYILRNFELYNEMNNILQHYGIAKFDWIDRVPRSVDEIQDIRVYSKPNHTMERIYDFMEEGIANGVNYADPRQTMKSYLEATYSMLVEKQLADELMHIGVGPKELISPKITEGLQRESDNIIRLQDQLAKVRNDLKFDSNNQGLRAIRNDLNRELRKARNRFKLLENNYAESYTKLTSNEGKVITEPWQSSLFGNHDKPMAIAQWKNNFMKEKMFFSIEDVRTLEEYVGINGRLLARDKVGVAATAMKDIGSLVRLISSGFDWALPSIHGLPVLSNNPKAFGKLMWHHYTAFFDLNRTDKLIADNYDTIQAMIRAKVPIDTEVFEAVEKGGVLNRLANPLVEKATGQPTQAAEGLRMGAKNTIGRFQSGYNSGLLAARIQLWKSMEGGFTDHQELGRTIRNLTAGLDVDLLNASRKQKAAEGMWMAFSSRMTRSAFALGAQAMELNTQGGRTAARTLVAMAGLMAGTTYLAGRYLFDMSDSELQDALDPTKGKKFLSVKTPFGYVGFGGTHRAISQLIANVGVAAQNGEWSKFGSADYFDNPILSFWNSRGAPFLSFSQALLEGWTGINADPYNDVDGMTDALKLMGQSFVPFWIMGKAEGNSNMLTFLDFQGARTSEYTDYEQRNQNMTMMFPEKAQELGRELTIEDLNKVERREFFDKYPMERDAENDNITRYYNEFEDIERRFNSDVAYWEALVSAGKRTRLEFREWYNERRSQKFDEIDQVKRNYSSIPADRKVKEGNDFVDFEGSVLEYLDSRATQPEDQAVNEWYSLPDKALRRDGSIDFDKLDKLRADFLEGLDKNVRDYVVAQTVKKPNFSANGIVDEYDRAKEITTPYWEAEANIFEEASQAIPFMSQFGSVEEYDSWVTSLAKQAGVDDVTMMALLEKKIPDIKLYEELVSEYKRLMRLTDPELDTALTDWYDIPPANRLGQLLANFGIEGGEIFAGTDQPSRAELAQLGLGFAAQGMGNRLNPMPSQRRSFHRTRFSFTNP